MIFFYIIPGTPGTPHVLAKRGLAWRNRWNTSGTPGTPTVLATRGLACWNTSKSTSSINSRKYREIPGTWHVSPERGLTEQIQLFYRGRPAAALQRCTRCTRSTGCSAAAAAAPAAALREPRFSRSRFVTSRAARSVTRGGGLLVTNSRKELNNARGRGC